MGFELQDFKKDVVEASNSVPVVIDFWAEWCGPCRQLTPVLEKLANEAGDRWKLVKINTDRNPDLAVQFNVRGIPSVKMVYQRQVIAEFTGAQPEHQVRQWLKQHLPEGGEDDSGEGLNKIKMLLGEGKRDEARYFISEQVDEDSSDQLKAWYAMLLLPGHIEKSEKWIDQIEERSDYSIQIEALETIKHLKSIEEGAAIEGNNEEALNAYRRGVGALFEEKFEEAIQQFIQTLQIDRELDDDGARKACVACFTMLSEHHPLTVQYRRQFSMSLY